MIECKNRVLPMLAEFTENSRPIKKRNENTVIEDWKSF